MFERLTQKTVTFTWHKWLSKQYLSALSAFVSFVSGKCVPFRWDVLSNI